jgi:hypothetical protein
VTDAARVAIATAAEFPDLDDDGPVLLAALKQRGIAGEPAVWTDPRIDWATYDLVVVRSTWDYAPRRDEFVAWAHRVEEVSRLANPAAVIEWNTDKTYLRVLDQAGLPVIATDWLEPGDTFVPPVQGEYVVKPAVSAGSKDTDRFRAGEHDELAVAHAAAILASGRTVMVQPYLHEVDTAGETALLYIGGEFSHAIRKGPMLTPAGGPVADLYKAEVIDQRTPSPAELEAGGRVLDALADLAPAGRADLIYARVDVVPDHDGDPTLIELELTEPSMFLTDDGTRGAQSAERFAAAIEAALA